ncbi:histone deacetylase 6-like protein, partial [Tanacetum coccineum]
MADEKKRQVTFFYEPRIGDYDYGQTHAMKPAIIIHTDELVRLYNIDKHMNVVMPYEVPR